MKNDTPVLNGITERWTTSPWGFRELFLPDYFRLLAQMGFRNACIHCNSQHPSGISEKLNEKEIVAVRALAEFNGLTIIELAGSFNLTVTEGIDLQLGNAFTGLDIARRLGAKYYRVFAGWIREELATEATYQQVIDGLRLIASRAEKLGITVVLENHGGVTRTAAQVKRFLDAVPSSAFGLNYDPANFMIHGEDPVEALKLLKNRVKFTHLKSTRLKSDGTREYCRVNEGEIDYAEIFDILLPDYDGPLGLEYEETSDVLEGTRDDYAALTAAMKQ